MSLPTLLVHADWSVKPEKRWMSVIERRRNGRFTACPPEPVGTLGSLMERLADRAHHIRPGGRIFLGIDVPIGLPSAYAAKAGIGSFLSALPRFGRGEWEDFYNVAARPEEIAHVRPFYPLRPGGARQQHLLRGLDVPSMEVLLRRVERRTSDRPAASTLFWTMGARQVGKAAISAWRDLLAPTLNERPGEVAVWPFDGRLDSLIREHPLTVAEVYPAEACVQLGLGPPGRRWSKRSAQDRTVHCGALTGWAQARALHLHPTLTACLENGFGDRPEAEDQFDSVVALFSMLEVVQGRRSAGVPDCAVVQSVEGWILGQQP